MSLSIKCDCCEKELEETGGLAFSPPIDAGQITKYHLCRDCWKSFTVWLNTRWRSFKPYPTTPEVKP